MDLSMDGLWILICSTSSNERVISVSWKINANVEDEQATLHLLKLQTLADLLLKMQNFIQEVL